VNRKGSLYTSRPATPPQKPDLSDCHQYQVTATVNGRSYRLPVKAPNENLALTASLSMMWEEHGIEPEADVRYTIQRLDA
jgi:hypothetical protein